MKINEQPVARGSMGIPPEMHAAFEKQREEAKKRQQPAPAAQHVTDGFGEEPARVDDPDAVVDTKIPESLGLDPEALLKEVSVDLTDDDLHRFVFKGFIEKEVKVSLFGGRKTITPTLKTLTANEYDAVGELLGEELDKTTIMRDEVTVRRNMWTLALGVSKIDGRPLTKPVMREVVVGDKPVQRVDLKATAKANREVLGSLAAPVVSELIVAHGKLSMALQLMTQSKGAEVLKK